MTLIDPTLRGRRRALLRAAGAAIALATAAYLPLAAAQELTIKLGHVGEPGSLFQKSADEFAKRANAKLAGKAKVVTYGSSQLGGDKEMIQKLKLGTLDMALPSTVMSRGRPLRHVRDALHRQGPRAHGADRKGNLGPGVADAQPGVPPAPRPPGPGPRLRRARAAARAAPLPRRGARPRLVRRRRRTQHVLERGERARHADYVTPARGGSGEPRRPRRSRRGSADVGARRPCVSIWLRPRSSWISTPPRILGPSTPTPNRRRLQRRHPRRPSGGVALMLSGSVGSRAAPRSAAGLPVIGPVGVAAVRRRAAA